jgi:hypothetical protein
MSARRLLVVPGLLATALVLIAATFTAAPALAAGAPEAPKTLFAKEIQSTSAGLNGVLNPGATAPVEAGTYEFLYKQSKTECEGESQAPATPGLYFGTGPEYEEQVVAGLSPGTIYAVCLRAENAGGATVGNPVAFQTAPEGPEILPAEDVTGYSATLRGVLNPNNASSPVLYHFKCVTGGGGEVDSALVEAAGHQGEAVSATLTELVPTSQYRCDLVADATIEGKNRGESSTETFETTTGPPAMTESDSHVGVAFARVSADIQPGGLPTSYYVEYGPNGSYGASTAEADLGASSNQKAEVTVQLSELQSSITYHFRFVATNALGTTRGADTTFTTFAPEPAGLPDGRVIERVSVAPPGQDTNAFITKSYAFFSDFYEHGQWSTTPYRISNNGEVVKYGAEPPPVGGEPTNAGSADVYLARRSPAGGPWTSELVSGNESAAKEMGEIFASEEATPYRLLSATAFDFLEGEGTLEKELAQDSKEGLSSLYDHVDGRYYLVNVLPEGKVAPNSTFGALPERQGFSESSIDDAISKNGSRIFWTWAPEANDNKDKSEGLPIEHRSKAIYMRTNPTQPQSPLENGKCTVPTDACTTQVDAAVGGEGIYLTANPEGSKVFFTKHDMYEYDVETGQTTDLTPGVEVVGLVAASENDEYIYYVDSSYELELWHNGAITDIAQLAAEDGYFVSPYEGGAGEIYFGDWQSGPGSGHTAEATPDGHSLVFMSSANLTGYGTYGDSFTGKMAQVYLYEAGRGALRCLSCNRSGEPPTPGAQEGNPEAGSSVRDTTGGFIHIEEGEINYRPRTITEDGSRVFFASGQPLVPQDSAGYLNVFEWERDGAGSCHEAQGCTFLLSNGAELDNSYLMGASANGDDVFYVTSEPGVGAEQVYDVRVDGRQPPTPPQCSGTGCQGVPGPPPIFATPASVTFNGVGNFAPPAPARKAITPKTKKCAKGSVKEHGKCVKKKQTKQKRRQKAKKANDDRRAKS